MRHGRPGQPNATRSYGSYELTLPKNAVRQLSWKRGDSLDFQLESNRLIVTPSPSQPQLQPVSFPTDKFPLDKIVCGDVLEVMRRIPDDSVQMAITSPPYNVQAGYVEYTDNREYKDYRKWLLEVWKETARVLCRGGRFALNIATTSIANYRPVHMDLSQDIEWAGLTPRTEILWYKQNMTAKRTAWGSFRSPRHPHVIPSWEYVLVFHKGSWKLDGDRTKADISSEDFVSWSDGMWQISPESSRIANHPAVFPEELIRRLVLYFTYRDNVVLDMFGGTGTVAVVAKKLGRHFIHIDNSPDYCRAAEQRLDGSFIPRGHRTKPSARSIARSVKPRTRSEEATLEHFGGVEPV